MRIARTIIAWSLFGVAAAIAAAILSYPFVAGVIEP